MTDVQTITDKVLAEVMQSLPPERADLADVAKTSADITARILAEYHRKERMGF